MPQLSKSVVGYGLSSYCKYSQRFSSNFIFKLIRWNSNKGSMETLQSWTIVRTRCPDEIIVGCSNVVEALWEGMLYHYKDIAAANTQSYTGYYIARSTIADAKFIKNDKVVIAEDTGCLKLLSYTEGGDSYIICDEVFKTNALVAQVATWTNSERIVACAGTSVIVADLQSTNPNPLEEYNNYHTNDVVSVDTNKHQPNTFASASFDRKACIWDDRTKISATVLYENQFSGLSSISWNPMQAEYIVVGTERGDVYNLDVRHPKEFVSSYTCFNYGVHRTAFNSSGYLAVGGDGPELLILNPKDNFNVVYRNNDHSSFVRGVVWAKETLYSCGHDKKIIKHVY